MRKRPTAAAALLIAGGLGLTACGGSAQPTAGRQPVTTQVETSATAAETTPVTSAPATATPAVSDADLARLDQQLADADTSLGAADQDVTHDETGDANP